MTLWTVACQAPLFKGLSRQEYWSGLPCSPPGDLPDPGLLHCKQILYCLNEEESPRVVEWIAIPSSGDLPNPGIELGSPELQVDQLYQLTYQERPTYLPTYLQISNPK